MASHFFLRFRHVQHPFLERRLGLAVESMSGSVWADIPCGDAFDGMAAWCVNGSRSWGPLQALTPQGLVG